MSNSSKHTNLNYLSLVVKFLHRKLTSMEIAPHISVDPNIHHGKVVISGTRLPVSIVVGSRFWWDEPRGSNARV